MYNTWKIKIVQYKEEKKSLRYKIRVWEMEDEYEKERRLWEMDGKKLRYTVPLSEKLHVNFFLMVLVQ